MKTLANLLRSLKPLAVALAASPLLAHAWTDKPVRIVVPAPAGGTMDVVARVMSEGIASEIGQTVIVDNKPGAGGAIGVQALLTAPADGQTLMFAVSNILTEIPLVMKTRFDPLKDVKPVTQVADGTMVLVAAPAVPANDLNSLIAYLKKKGEGSYASYSTGTSSHYAGAIFAKKLGLDLQHIPFPGSPPALQNLMGNQVDIMFDGLATSDPLVKAGKVKLFGVGAKQRLSQLPDVPTLAEQGFPEIDFSNWAGAVVSAKVPESLVQKMNAVISKVAATPRVREKLLANQFVPVISENPEALARVTRAEYERNAQIVRAHSIRMD